jgi:hypothetical protein
MLKQAAPGERWLTQGIALEEQLLMAEDRHASVLRHPKIDRKHRVAKLDWDAARDVDPPPVPQRDHTMVAIAIQEVPDRPAHQALVTAA